jgi:hypothetical protein
MKRGKCHFPYFGSAKVEKCQSWSGKNEKSVRKKFQNGKNLKISSFFKNALELRFWLVCLFPF